MHKAVFLLTLLGTYQVPLAIGSNIVQFHGEINTQTCIVNIDGHSGNPVVLLPTVSADKLATAGATTGETPFHINIYGCQTSMTDTPISVRFVTTSPTSNGNLRNTLTSNGNVSIQIVDNDGTPLSFFNGRASTKAIRLFAGDNKDALMLTARYYAEGDSVSAGAVLASAQFSISYN